jgi:hypothetical protein
MVEEYKNLKNNSIHIENYYIESERKGYNQYNLYKETIIAKGKNAGKSSIRNMGWAMRMEKCVLKMAEDAQWSEEKKRNLHDYLDEKIKVINGLLVEFLNALEKRNHKL